MNKFLACFDLYVFEFFIYTIFGKLEKFFCRYLHSYLFRSHDVYREFLPIKGYFFRVASCDDVENLSKFVVDRTKIVQRIDRGDVCFVAVRECDGCIVSVLWTATGFICSPYTGSSVDTGDDGFIIYSGKTLDSEQSKGLYGSLLCMAVSYYRLVGRCFVYGIVDIFNKKSLEIKRKYNFYCIGESYYCNIFMLNITYYKSWYISEKKIHVFLNKSSCGCKIV